MLHSKKKKRRSRIVLCKGCVVVCWPCKLWRWEQAVSSINIRLLCHGNTVLAILLDPCAYCKSRRVLCCAVFCCAVLCCAVLWCAVLCSAVLCCVECVQWMRMRRKGTGQKWNNAILLKRSRGVIVLSQKSSKLWEFSKLQFDRSSMLWWFSQIMRDMKK